MSVGEDLRALGWGSTADFVADTEMPDQLQQIGVVVREDSECWEAQEKPIAQTQLCTKANRSGFMWLRVGGTRRGDSGGPTIAREDGQWIQHGVLSHGPRICHPSKCDGFWDFLPYFDNDGDPNYDGWISVAQFRDWIHATTGLN